MLITTVSLVNLYIEMYSWILAPLKSLWIHGSKSKSLYSSLAKFLTDVDPESEKCAWREKYAIPSYWNNFQKDLKMTELITFGDLKSILRDREKICL